MYSATKDLAHLSYHFLQFNLLYTTYLENFINIFTEAIFLFIFMRQLQHFWHANGELDVILFYSINSKDF